MYKKIKRFVISIWEKISSFFKRHGNPSEKSVKRHEKYQIGASDFYWIYLTRKSRQRARKIKYQRLKAYVH